MIRLRTALFAVGLLFAPFAFPQLLLNSYLWGADLPSGLIAAFTSSCPTGWTEVAAMNGKTIIGTLAANGDAGTTGGADNITPAGTNSAPAFTGSAWSAPAVSWPAGTPVFTGTSSQSTSSVSAGTPAGTNATSTVTPLGTVAAPVISWPAGVPTQATHTHDSHTTAATGSSGASRLSGPTTHSAIAAAISWPAGVPTNTAPTFTGSSSTVAAQVFTGSALATHSHTLTPGGTNAWPAGVPTIAAYTPAGTVAAPVFTGSSFDNRSAFYLVIFCSKN